MKDANIISFAIKVGADGSFFTEVSYLPEDKVDKCFQSEDAVFVRKILREMHSTFSELHHSLEKEIQASNSIL